MGHARVEFFARGDVEGPVRAKGEATAVVTAHGPVVHILPEDLLACEIRRSAPELALRPQAESDQNACLRNHSCQSACALARGSATEIGSDYSSESRSLSLVFNRASDSSTSASSSRFLATISAGALSTNLLFESLALIFCCCAVVFSMSFCSRVT